MSTALARSWRRLHPVTRGLILLALASTLLLNAVLLALPATPKRLTALQVAAAAATFLKVADNADSWYPMLDARRLLSDQPGVNLYQELFFDRGTKFQYAPTSLLFTEPVHRLALSAQRPDPARGPRPGNWVPAYLALQAFTFILMWVNVLLVVLIFHNAWKKWGPAPPPGVDPRLDAAARALLAACLTLAFYPAAKAMQLGQLQVWINTLLSAAVLLWMSGRLPLAGAAIGLACLMKPHYGLILIWGLVRRRWGFGLAGLAVCAAGSLLSIALYGFNNHLEYLRVIAFLGERGESFFANHSVNGLLNRLLDNGNNAVWDPTGFPPYHPVVRWGTFVTSLAFIAAALFIRRRDEPASAAGLLGLLIAALSFTIASPIAWQHHYGVMLPVFAVLAAVLAGRAGAGDRFAHLALLALAACWAVCANFFGALQHLASTPFTPVQSYLFFAALAVLAILYAARARTPAPRAQ